MKEPANQYVGSIFSNSTSCGGDEEHEREEVNKGSLLAYH